MTSPRKIQIRSPAKINVFLEVHGKRDDGFHELETIMLKTDLCDMMSFEASDPDDDRLHLRLADDSLPTTAALFPLDQSNLILKAANALRSHAGVSFGANITINKRIPSMAGLAGGSGNAATTLCGLNRIWRLNLSKATLHEIAASLGSDVNFFVEGCRAAICRGRGERVEPVRLRHRLYLIAARPTIGNSTADVFGALLPSDQKETVGAVLAAMDSGNVEQLAAASFNRLTEVARQQNPQMHQLMSDMQTICDRPVHMSGSGSTCFLFARSQREAMRLQAKLVSLETSFLCVTHV